MKNSLAPLRAFLSVVIGTVACYTITAALASNKAMAWFGVCNDSSEKVYVAFAYVEARDNRETVNRRYPIQGISQWKSEGWWNLNPGQCSQVYPHELWRRNRYYYVYAENASGTKVWGGDYKICVGRGQSFTVEQADLQIATPSSVPVDGCFITGEGDAGRRRIERVGFRRVDIGGGETQNYTYRLSSSSETPSNTGFYKQQDRPEVYLVYRPGFYCHVQNEDQMNAFGGFGRIQVVGSLKLNGTNTGDCGWPNGFFRRSNQPEVYRMYGSGTPEFNIGDGFCHVQNEAQMNAYGGFSRVRVVSPNSDLGRGRTSTGGCPNP